MPRGPEVPGRGPAPYLSTSAGHVTASQMRYYGKRGLEKYLGISPARTGYRPFGPDDIKTYGLREVDGRLTAGLTSQSMRRDMAFRFSDPEILNLYQEYAKQYPQMDPRTWVPLAEMRLHPTDPAAVQAMRADRVRQYEMGVYGGTTLRLPNVPSLSVRLGSNAADPRLSGAINALDPPSLPGETPAGQTTPGMTPQVPMLEFGTAPLDDANQQAADDAAAREQGLATLQSAGIDTGNLPVFQQASEGDRDDFLSTIEGKLSIVPSGVETASRLALTGLFAPLQAGQGLLRSALGARDHQYDIARKHGLSEMETRIAFGDLSDPDAAANVRQPDLAANAALRPGEQAPQTTTPPTLESLPKDRQDAILAARQDWEDTAAHLPGLSDQIDLVQGIQHPEYLFDPDMGGTGFLPNPRLSTELTDKASGLVFDVRSDEVKERAEKTAKLLRMQAGQMKERINSDPKYLWAYSAVHGTPVTPLEMEAARRYMEENHKIQAAIDAQVADQVAKVVAPVGWTPGRGTAAIWMDSDTAEFQTISGILDIGASLAMDPLTYVGAGVATKVAEHIPGTLAHALRPGSDMVLARLPTDQFGRRIASAAHPAASTSAAIAELKAAGGKVYNFPGMKMNENGKVLTPHRLVAVPENFVTWLQGAKGQRVVNELAKMDDPIDILMRSNWKMDTDLVKALAKADNPDAVMAALATRTSALHTKSLGRIGNVASTLQVPLFRRMSLEELGRKPGFSWLTGGTADDSAARRLFRQAPMMQPIDWREPGFAVRQLYAWANGVGVSNEALRPSLNRALTATNRAEFYQATKGVFEQAATHLASKRGLTEKEANRLTRIFDETGTEDINSYVNADIGDAFGQGARGEGRAMVMDEVLNGQIFLPDYRQARRAAGVIGAFRSITPGLTRSGFKEGPGGQMVLTWETAVEDALTRLNSAWKYSVLLRPAYMLRNIGEMAFAAGLAGYSRNNPFTRPDTFLAGVYAAAVAKDATTFAGRATKALLGEPVVGATSAGDWLLSGTAIPAGTARAFADNVGLSTAFDTLYPYADRNQMRLTGDAMWEVLHRNPDQAPQLLERGLSELHQNLSTIDEPLAASMAKQIKVAMRDTPGQEDAYLDAYIERLMRLHNDPTVRDLLTPDQSIRKTLDNFRKHNKSIRATMRPDLLDDSLAKDREFVRGLGEVAQAYHQSDPVLMEAIRTGKFQGEDIRSSDALRAHLTARLDEKDKVFRNNAPGGLHYLDLDEGGKVGWIRKRITNFFQGAGELEDITMRIPVMRQTYLERVEALAPYLTAAERAEALAKARKSGDKRLARAITKNPRIPGGTLTADALDLSAQGAAVRAVEAAFYNAQRRQNWALMLRIVSPFAQSWANTLRRWGTLAIRNPQMAYRTIKPLYALEQPGSGIIYNAVGTAIGDEGLQAMYTPDRPDLSVDGFFYTNEYGEREFVYPGIGRLAQLMPFVGAPEGTQFKSGMGSLNVAGELLQPGSGPWLTLPMTLLANNLAYRDDPIGALTRFVFPFGSPPEGSPLERAMATILPTAGRKVLQATDPEQSMTTIVQMMGTLIGTGKYNLSDPKERTRLVSEAQELAGRVSLFSAISGAITPSTVQPMLAQAIDSDTDPRPLAFLAALSGEFHKYTKNAPSYEVGLANFVEDYGDTALLSVLPKTNSANVQATNDVWAWRTDYPESYDAYNSIAGLMFAATEDSPSLTGDSDGPNQFSRTLYEQQKQSGERVARTPKEMLDYYTNALGDMLWNKATQDLAYRTNLSSTDIAIARGQIAREIRDKFPGWSPSRNMDTVATRISDLERATSDPTPDEGLEATPGWEYVKTYMAERRKAMAIAETRGSGNLSTKQNQDLAEHLATIAGALMRVDDSGAFTNAWTRVLEHELGDVTEPEEAN